MECTTLRGVVQGYQKLLKEAGVEPFEDQNAPPCRVLNHCAWMLERMDYWLMGEKAPAPATGSTDADVQFVYQPPQAEIEKCFRWLGFVQGVFCVQGVFTTNDMRSHNRTGQVSGGYLLRMTASEPDEPPGPA
jgi:hypothetical protein